LDKRKKEGVEVANYSYLRVSTDKQDLDNQRVSVLEYANKNGLHDVQFVEETVSSKLKDRKIFELVETLKDGDTLIVFELSRLARSMKELESIRVKVADRGADIHAISQNLIIKSDGNDIATKSLVFALELSAQIERDMISERTRNALAIRKSKGLPMGRPKGDSKVEKYREDIEKYFKLGINVTAIAKLIGCSRSTLNNWLKENKSSLDLSEVEK